MVLKVNLGRILKTWNLGSKKPEDQEIWRPGNLKTWKLEDIEF